MSLQHMEGAFAPGPTLGVTCAELGKMSAAQLKALFANVIDIARPWHINSKEHMVAYLSKGSECTIAAKTLTSCAAGDFDSVNSFQLRQVAKGLRMPLARADSKTVATVRKAFRKRYNEVKKDKKKLKRHRADVAALKSGAARIS